jgi:DNA-directed RNA polymerase specialized sigma24 family protein
MIDWGAILAEYGSTVWRTVYRLLDHHDDALDCYQETFLAAFRFAHAQTIADWPAFLVKLATRRAIDRLRQRYRFGADQGSGSGVGSRSDKKLYLSKRLSAPYPVL